MTHRTLTLQVPRRHDDRAWVAVQIEVPAVDGGWQSIQAIRVPAQTGRGRRRLTVPCIAPDDADQFRAVWVPDGGTAAGLHITDPAPLA